MRYLSYINHVASVGRRPFVIVDRTWRMLTYSLHSSEPSLVVADFVDPCYPMKRHYPSYDRAMDRRFRVYHAVRQIFQNHIRRYQLWWVPHSGIERIIPSLLLFIDVFCILILVDTSFVGITVYVCMYVSMYVCMMLLLPPVKVNILCVCTVLLLLSLRLVDVRSNSNRVLLKTLSVNIEWRGYRNKYVLGVLQITGTWTRKPTWWRKANLSLSITAYGSHFPPTIQRLDAHKSK